MYKESWLFYSGWRYWFRDSDKYGMALTAVTDDFGTLVEVDKHQTAYSLYRDPNYVRSRIGIRYA